MQVQIVLISMAVLSLTEWDKVFLFIHFPYGFHHLFSNWFLYHLVQHVRFISLGCHSPPWIQEFLKIFFPSLRNPPLICNKVPSFIPIQICLWLPSKRPFVFLILQFLCMFSSTSFSLHQSSSSFGLSILNSNFFPSAFICCCSDFAFVALSRSSCFLLHHFFLARFFPYWLSHSHCQTIHYISCLSLIHI